MYILKHEQIMQLIELANRYETARDPIKVLLKALPDLDQRITDLETRLNAQVQSGQTKKDAGQKRNGA